MKEREIVKALKQHLEKQPPEWRFVYGREVLTKEKMIEKIKKDKRFRKFMVTQVEQLSIDLLLRGRR